MFENLKSAVRDFLGVQEAPLPSVKIKSHYPEAYYSSSGSYRQYAVTFNGEKNLGEIGPIKNYRPDYVALRFRSWQAYLESELAQTIIKKFTKWIVGAGLKLQAEPAKTVLKSEGVTINSEIFNELVEARFAIFGKSKALDYSNKRSLHQLATRAFIEAKVGGDVLVILRYIDNQVNVQLVDGVHVQSPLFGDEFFANQLQNGNEVRNGVELSMKGEHVAYYVRKGPIMNGQVLESQFEFERILAKDDSGMSRAFLIYGMEYRLDGNRGLPLISALLETLKKLERYKEATLGSAEERQKIAYFFTHTMGSTGEFPLNKNLAKAFNVGASDDDIPVDVQSKAMADTVSVTTNKQVFNLPQETDVKSMEGKTELYFKDFYTVLGNLLCSAVNMPPDVAFSKYDSNYSASRAAIKDWEHTIVVERKEFSDAFYQPIYNFWLDIQILLNKIKAPGYLLGRIDNNPMVLNAYRNARWVGAPVPHIDPMKEVEAERAKLGILAEHIPLTTVEAATEALNGGESDHNIAQFADEIEAADKLGVKPPPPPAPIVPTGKTPVKKAKKVES